MAVAEAGCYNSLTHVRPEPAHGPAGDYAMPEPEKLVLNYRAGKQTGSSAAHKHVIRFVLWMAGFIVAGFAVALLASLHR